MSLIGLTAEHLVKIILLKRGFVLNTGNFDAKFTNDFINRYENELMEIQDLNKIIDVSDFEDTKEIIEENFKLYFT